MKLKKLTYISILKRVLILLIFTLVFLYDFLFKYISFIDELLAVITIALLFFVKKIKLLRAEYMILRLLFLIIFLGLLSNITSEQKIVGKVIFLDLLSFVKPFVVYFGVRIFFRDISFKTVYPALKKIIQYALLVLIIIIFADYVFHIFPRDQRFGLTSLELFFTHPSRLSFAISFIFIILYPKYIKKSYLLVFILLIGLVTLRVKYFGFLLIALLFIYYRRIIVKINKRYFYALMMLIPIGLFIIFKDWIYFYFVNNDWSRNILLKYSFKIGADFFPLGTGFGSYACYFSGQENYSWVYAHYGIDDVWGISKEFNSFLSDQYWPMILGQFGYFGLLAMFLIIIKYFEILIGLLNSTESVFVKNSVIATVLGLILLLIDSTSDAIFSQNRGVVIFIIIALVVNHYIDYNTYIDENTSD
jgi:hypothetical protein